MNESTYTSVLRELRGINMNERDRARAEDGVRKSAVIVELLVGVFGRRSQEAETRS